MIELTDIAESRAVKNALRNCSNEIYQLTGISVKVGINLQFCNPESSEKVNSLQQLVCREFNLTWPQITGKRIEGLPVIDARHTFMYLAYLFLNMTQYQIVQECRKKDHTTVHYAVYKINRCYQIKDDVTQKVERVKFNLFEYLNNQ